MSLEENVRQVKENIAAAAREAGRDPSEITLVAATKVQTDDTIRAAIAAGITVCGENRVQEMTAHLEANAYAGSALHFIGHLQTNKVRQIVDKVQMIESLDSFHLAREIEKQCAAIDKVMDVLVEVNIGKEENKSGIFPEQLDELLQQVAQLGHLKVRGLMTIPPVCENNEQVSQYFSRMRQLFIDIKQKKYDNINMEILSMGMSGDYPAAVKYGSNIVRIGTAMFGHRNYKGAK